MTIHRSRRIALGTALAVVAAGAFAGEITLFDRENFQGNRAVFRDTVTNLGDTSFNDRTESISVRDGTWEACFHADFQGSCMQLAPGDYPRLDPPFNRSISSLRQIGGAEYGGSYPAAPPQGGAATEITLFDGESFQGNRIAFADIVPNLAGLDFNDRTASISVRGGTWEVCFDADFQGGCMQLPPGDYPRLDPPFNRSISSVRPLGGPEYGGGYPAPQPDVGMAAEVPGASIGIDLPVYPELVPVPDYPVYYAPQLDSNYFFYDGMYWVYQRDTWYASSWFNGPWALVTPEVVPLFVLRIPVRYYRRPPVYFRGWHSDAPPRWGERWGNAWERNHRGWDRWNRRAAPAPAPLPLYQRQFSGNRYPRVEQQRDLQNRNYRYQPRDAVVQQHWRAQQVQGQPARSPRQGDAARTQPPQQGAREMQRPAPAPAPSPQQGIAPTQRAQPPQQEAREMRRPAPTPAPSPQQGIAPTQRALPPQQGAREMQRPAPTPAPSPQQGIAPSPRALPPQPAAQRQLQPPQPQGEDKGPQGRAPAQEPRKAKERDRE